MPQPVTHAEERAFEALATQGRRSAAAALKRRARSYAKQPMALETLYPGLAAATPQSMIAIAEHLLENERRAPQRWFGFGGEVKALNAKAALLYARTLRRKPRNEN